MRRLVFIDDDETELSAFRSVIVDHYEYVTVHWPQESEKLFRMAAPDIFVSDLYLPPDSGDVLPTEAQRQEAVAKAKKVEERFSRLYSSGVLDDKARLRETMRAIVDAYNLLELQWSALGQSPNHGIALLRQVRPRHTDVPFVFYSRKITPEDVIRVLQAGAVDAIRKGSLRDEEVLQRLSEALQFYVGENAQKLRADSLNANITVIPKA